MSKVKIIIEYDSKDIGYMQIFQNEANKTIFPSHWKESELNKRDNYKIRLISKEVKP